MKLTGGWTGCKLLAPGEHKGQPSAISAAQRSSFPRRVDHRPAFDEIVAQGEIGSCVGNGSALAFAQRLAAQGLGTWRPSRLQIYRACLRIDGTWPRDEGTYVETAVKVLSEQGAGPESLAPYSDAQRSLRRDPSDAYVSAAARCRLVSWQPLELDRDSFKFELLAGHPIVFAMSLRESFDRVGDDGAVPVPRRGEEEIGGHCMRCVGYDEDGLVVANSWGRRWGCDGYCFLPWSVATDPQHMRSAYSFQTVRCAG